MLIVMTRGVRGVSHVQGDGRGYGTSAMFKVMGGVRGFSNVQGDGRGYRGVSHVQCDVRGVSHFQGDGGRSGA